MGYLIFVFLLGVVSGLVAVASNPSPYFAAFGLVVVAGMGCGVLVSYGGSFLSLVLFLIYLGGMLVVFAYSAALAAEPYPEGLWDGPVFNYVTAYFLALGMFAIYFWGGWYEFDMAQVEEYEEYCVLRADLGGVAVMYSVGGGMLLVSAWVLLLTLFVVLELTRGLNRGALRAV